MNEKGAIPWGLFQVEDDGAETKLKCPDCGAILLCIADTGLDALKLEHPIICCGQVRMWGYSA